jgi:hypothetical protein
MTGAALCERRRVALVAIVVLRRQARYCWVLAARNADPRIRSALTRMAVRLSVEAREVDVEARTRGGPDAAADFLSNTVKRGERQMSTDPQRLRAQAALCRQMSARRGAHAYLLELAERLEVEAGEIESRIAGRPRSHSSAPD